MKKSLKIFLISLASLVLLLVIVVSIALWVVFTPERLTPIVRNQADKYLTCQTEIRRVELTFFSTFPHFELKANNVKLKNTSMEYPCGDALLSVGKITAKVDVKALLKNKELLLDNICLADGEICVSTDAEGNANYDVFVSDTTAVDDSDSEFPFKRVDVSSLELKNMNVVYVDEMSGTTFFVDSFSAKMKGSLKMPDIAQANLEIYPFNLSFINDSLKVRADLQNFSTKLSADLNSDNVRADISIPSFKTYLDYAGESYINGADLELTALAGVDLSTQRASFERLMASVNGMALNLNGIVGNDTVSKGIFTDIAYKLETWNLTDLVALVPPSFEHYLEGIDVSGKISSAGKIKGLYNDSVMPLVDANLSLHNISVGYAEMLPFPVTDINGDISVYTDLSDDAISYVNINTFKAKTPKSSLQTAGKIDRLFSDMHIDLKTNVSLHLAEFNTLVPDSMKVDMKGNVAGSINTDVTMQQIEKMQLEKMKVSGTLALNGLDVVYDSLSLKTDYSKVDFRLPNNNPSGRGARFVAANITSNSLKAQKKDAFSASLKDTQLKLEASDIRDTTGTPAVYAHLISKKIEASADSMSVLANEPSLDFAMAPQRRNAGKPRFSVKYNGGSIRGNLGSEKVDLETINLGATVTYDEAQEDVFMRFMPRGFVDLKNGVVATSMLSYPVEIPAVKMDFTPREFEVENVGVKMGASDFTLCGKLSNILPYFRGDSILRGDFTFHSPNTDILQIMSMTSGAGSDEKSEKKPEAEEDSFSGPYMVPKGMDILLHTDIKQATFGIDTITKIKGDVRVHDGILVMDDLTFTTPGADMQLTAMYRTPRKNHLYVGLDFHMLEIEISDLLSMIPELDSIMPMLRSFGGKGEFHIAAETYLDSLYNVKMSTIRGASSIRGEDLVLMDGETFSEIAKMLRFNKKTENKVDSLSAEFTVFRDEIDVYPFLIVMDKYKAVVGGRHNLDMSFDYNISLVDSPLPFRASVDVSGNLDKMKFKLAKAKYPDFYRPVSRKVVDSEQMQLRKLIRESVTQKVVKKEEEDE
ncbi:AsmA family protein [Paludibacter sp. 221]|uniref:AsmA family protein n=1 Tax=Paludibacter sp. 221 TaxID=2302939 RepID=UPI0013D1DFA0|nr:AsmA family protein [Paludibacter sp. 221]NDV46778.1 AsmA family protein [Paludibacter sp. 221]